MGTAAADNTDVLTAARDRYDSNLVHKEHLARYFFILPLFEGKDVLEIGSGWGDGTALIARKARRIVGVEPDRYRLEFAARRFRAENIFFTMADARRLAFADSCFDAVLALEVIEHIDEQKDFLAELTRVLKPGGFAVLSTPNREVVKNEGSVSNRDHKKELTKDEFESLLLGFFQSLEWFGQRRGAGVRGKAGALHTLVRRLDVFGLRGMFSRTARNSVFSAFGRMTGAKRDPETISVDDFPVSGRHVDTCRNLIVICREKVR